MHAKDLGEVLNLDQQILPVSLSSMLAHGERRFDDSPIISPTPKHKNANVQGTKDGTDDNPSETGPSQTGSHWAPFLKPTTSSNKPDTSEHARLDYPKDQSDPLQKAADGARHSNIVTHTGKDAGEGEAEGEAPSATGMPLSWTDLPFASKDISPSSPGVSPTSKGLLQDNKGSDNFIGGLRGGAGEGDGRRQRVWKKIKSGLKKLKAFVTRQPIQNTGKAGNTGTTGVAGKTGTAGTQGTGQQESTRGRRSASLHSIAVSASSDRPLIPRQNSRRCVSIHLPLSPHPADLGPQDADTQVDTDAESQQGDASSSGRLRGGAGEGDDGRRKRMWRGLKKGAKKIKAVVTRSPGTTGEEEKLEREKVTPTGKKATSTGKKATPKGEKTTGSEEYGMTTFKKASHGQREDHVRKVVHFADERGGSFESASSNLNAIARAPLRGDGSDDPPQPMPGPQAQVVEEGPQVSRPLPLTGTGFEYYTDIKFLERFRTRSIEAYPDYAELSAGKENKGKGKAKEEVPVAATGDATTEGGGQTPAAETRDNKGKGKAKEEIPVATTGDTTAEGGNQAPAADTRDGEETRPPVVYSSAKRLRELGFRF
ncbi:hypothetical protein QBC36DRAFT_314645 [Triangularia setosa]|uniref:Uncharacterized protein n=1 Tax=Triangularia setosa TaxID=2587417 RepID=A0AAN6W1M7_9PEZI|nr:hypothetical protein QBC36DRAFT_314645 [Podospora setosa]